MEEIKKTNSIKTLLLVLLFVGLSFFVPSSSYADSYDRDAFTSSNTLYCVRHSLGFDYQTYTFVSKYRIDISGKDATIYSVSTSDRINYKYSGHNK